jgi:lipid-A-disaccharide synthase
MSATVLLSAGDASGDVYAADLVRELRALRPTARFLGLGGAQMEKAGVEITVDQREVAVGGLVELLPDLHRIVSAWRRLAAALKARRPDLVVLVDSGGFNLPFARLARRAGVPVLYYVAPQVWAWRRGRVRKLARRVDRLAVILPFEPAVYAREGVRVDFVGHPLVEHVRRATAGLDRAAARRNLGLPADAIVVALLPGSRRNELRHGASVQLESARCLHRRDPRIRFALPLAPTLERSAVEARIRAARLPAGLRLDRIEGRSLEVLCACDAALVKPGTATLEAALLGRPLVVAARSHPLTAAVLRRLVKVDWLALPNLIAAASIVPEFLQNEAEPERIAAAVVDLLRGPAREAQLAALAQVRDRLEEGGPAARHTATIAEEMIRARRCA